MPSWAMNCCGQATIFSLLSASCPAGSMMHAFAPLDVRGVQYT
jgi:hypothetical protein